MPVNIFLDPLEEIAVSILKHHPLEMVSAEPLSPLSLSCSAPPSSFSPQTIATGHLLPGTSGMAAEKFDSLFSDCEVIAIGLYIIGSCSNFS